MSRQLETRQLPTAAPPCAISFCVALTEKGDTFCKIHKTQQDYRPKQYSRRRRPAKIADAALHMVKSAGEDDAHR